jgi:hypothetical protein
MTYDLRTRSEEYISHGTSYATGTSTQASKLLTGVQESNTLASASSAEANTKTKAEIHTTVFDILQHGILEAWFRYGHSIDDSEVDHLSRCLLLSKEIIKVIRSLFRRGYCADSRLDMVRE